MSGLSVQEAIGRLQANPSAYATPEALRALAASLDVSASGNVTVLYSGNVGTGIPASSVVTGMLSNGENIRTIDQTQAARFFQSEEFLRATAEAHGIRPDALTTPGSLPIAFSTRCAQAAHVIPPIGIVTELFFVFSTSS